MVKRYLTWTSVQASYLFLSAIFTSVLVSCQILNLNRQSVSIGAVSELKSAEAVLRNILCMSPIGESYITSLLYCPHRLQVPAYSNCFLLGTCNCESTLELLSSIIIWWFLWNILLVIGQSSTWYFPWIPLGYNVYSSSCRPCHILKVYSYS